MQFIISRNTASAYRVFSWNYKFFSIHFHLIICGIRSASLILNFPILLSSYLPVSLCSVSVPWRICSVRWSIRTRAFGWAIRRFPASAVFYRRCLRRRNRRPFHARYIIRIRVQPVFLIFFIFCRYILRAAEARLIEQHFYFFKFYLAIFSVFFIFFHYIYYQCTLFCRLKS